VVRPEESSGADQASRKRCGRLSEGRGRTTTAGRRIANQHCQSAGLSTGVNIKPSPKWSRLARDFESRVRVWFRLRRT